LSNVYRSKKIQAETISHGSEYWVIFCDGRNGWLYGEEKK